MSGRLAAAFRTAGLSERQGYVLRQRVAGRSYGDLAAELGCSRQAVQCCEQHGMAKLGLEGSVAEVVYAEERLEAAERLRERGRLVRPGDLHHTDLTVPWHARHTAAERRHEAAVAAFLAGR